MKKHKPDSMEHRRYVRLETVFPIEFQVYSKETGQAVSGLKQGFTRNVSEGGVCLEANELENGFVPFMSSGSNELGLYINLPHHKEPIQARGEIRWQKKISDGYPNKYHFGIEYINIEDNTRKQIFAYAKKIYRKPKIIAAGIGILVLACAGLLFQIYNLGIKKSVTEKKLLSLSSELAKSHEKRAALENKIYIMNQKSQRLDKNLNESKEMIDSLEKRLQKMSSLGDQLSDELLAQKMTLENKLIYWQGERKEYLKKMQELKISRKAVNEELGKISDFEEKRIVRIWFANGTNIIGQLIDAAGDRLTVKIGLGTVGIDRTMIKSIKKLSKAEKLDIEKLWQRQEEEAMRDEQKYKRFLEKQRRKGLVYYNGKWIRERELKAIEEELKKKEEEVFQLIAQQASQTISGGKKTGVLEQIIRKWEKPVISIKDRKIYLNGILFFIKGVGYGIEYPGTNGSVDTYKHVPFGVFEKDFRMMKEAGVNTIRTYEPLPDNILDLAEKYGIMVIENVCYPSGNTDFNSRVHLDILKEQIQRYVMRDRDRKCILMWSIWNDAPWAWEAGGNVVKKYDFAKVNGFLKELYNTVKRNDITHPVTASNAVGIEGENMGWDFLDVIGLNLYIGGYDWFIEQEAVKNIAEAKAIEEKYNKPVVILETGFSTYIKGQDQAEVLEKQIKAVGTNLCGITIFQWADGWQKAGNKDKQDDNIEEHWGILDGYRNPKPGYKAVCRAFAE